MQKRGLNVFEDDSTNSLFVHLRRLRNNNNKKNHACFVCVCVYQSTRKSTHAVFFLFCFHIGIVQSTTTTTTTTTTEIMSSLGGEDTPAIFEHSYTTTLNEITGALGHCGYCEKKDSAVSSSPSGNTVFHCVACDLSFCVGAECAATHRSGCATTDPINVMPVSVLLNNIQKTLYDVMNLRKVRFAANAAADAKAAVAAAATAAGAASTAMIPMDDNVPMVDVAFPVAVPTASSSSFASSASASASASASSASSSSSSSSVPNEIRCSTRIALARTGTGQRKWWYQH
jgi:hypothetical protein